MLGIFQHKLFLVGKCSFIKTTAFFMEMYMPALIQMKFLYQKIKEVEKPKS